MAEKRIYVPLFDNDKGGSAKGFSCQVDVGDTEAKPCRAVTRTERGMLSHLWSVHRIKRQGSLFGPSRSAGHREAARDEASR